MEDIYPVFDYKSELEISYFKPTKEPFLHGSKAELSSWQSGQLPWGPRTPGALKAPSLFKGYYFSFVFKSYLKITSQPIWS